jgi:CDP-diacylglycerol--serine O-phosphatidyltransferase
VDAALSDRLRQLAPNLITFMASVSALATLYVAFYWKTRAAAWFLIAAGICDALDGVVARRLNAQSRFGNFYDSMSDFLAFGIAPVFSLVFLGLLHPVVAGLYSLAIQFRLTRYSAMPSETSATRFFQGVSAPDCVYLGVLIGFVPWLDFNWGFTLASLLAVYPGKLMPKGYFIVKFLIGLGTLVAFMYGVS